MDRIIFYQFRGNNFKNTKQIQYLIYTLHFPMVVNICNNFQFGAGWNFFLIFCQFRGNNSRTTGEIQKKLYRPHLVMLVRMYKKLYQKIFKFGPFAIVGEIKSVFHPISKHIWHQFLCNVF